MGRLTDNLLAVIGQKPSDRVSKVPLEADHNIPNTAAVKGSTNDTPTKVPGTPTSLHQDTAPTIELIGTAGETPAGAGGIVKDCFGCKLLGVGVGVGGSGTVAYLAYKEHSKYRGMKKVLFFTQAFLLSSTMLGLGLARIFDAGIFNPSKQGMTIQEHLAQDAIGVFKFVGAKPPAILTKTLDKSSENGSSS